MEMTMAKWTAENIGDQSGKTAIVTGANSGLGFATACTLADKGAHVVLACRSRARGEAALEKLMQAHPDAHAELILVDLGDLASVKAFSKTITEKFDALHVLVNNAGIMFPPFQKTVDGFESQFGINHLGHFALTAQLMPLLAKTPGARVVNVSSVGHKIGPVDLEDPNFETRKYGKLKSYGQSKLANLLFTYELQRRLEAAGLDVQAMAAHPGWTNTNLQDETAWIRWFNPIFAMPPHQGALPSLYGAVAEEAEGGAYYGPDGLLEWRGYPKRVQSNKASHDLEKAAGLWDLSERLTGVRFDLSKKKPVAARAVA